MSHAPETYDPWVMVRWALQNQDNLYIRVQNIAIEGDPPPDPLFRLVPLRELTPQWWVFHVQRLHHDRKHPLMTKTEWAAWERQQQAADQEF